MDPKKQQMNPELKAIYDRVMSTSAAPQGAGATPQASTPPPAANPSTPSTPTAAAQPEAPTPQLGGLTSVPPPPPPPPTALGQTPPPVSTSQAPATPATPGMDGKPVGSGTFVFNGSKVVSSDKAAGGAKTGKKIPGFLIPIGVLIFVAAWAALWAKVFKLF